jgi:penicillin-binding protein 1A
VTVGRGGRSRTALVAIALFVLAQGCAFDPINLSEGRPLDLRTTVVASDGSFLARLYKKNRTLVSIDQIPQPFIDAVIAVEDQRFFEHDGFDLRSIARAAIINWREGRIVQGGSTITQQYVKNTYFRNPPKTLERKARELRLAIEIERRYTKEEILERYLNTVYFGQGAYGIEAASETYFDKNVRSLNLQESALLSALIKSPAHYDPRDHPKKARVRRNYVLNRMMRLDMITRTDGQRAKKTPVVVTPEPPKLPTRQPYFVEAVKREIMRDTRFGGNEAQRANALWKGGLTVKTTLVPFLQRAAERAINETLNQPGDPSAALVAIKPRTGEIVAMVGGRDWKASQVNLALGVEGGGSGRQPGSSFKPIVAAAALERGIQLSTLYESSPAIFTFEEDGSTWTVGNYEGGGGGLLPLDEAMVHSVNGVYARLGLEIGPSQIAGQAELMGVKAKLPIYPSIALGSADVSVLDMATAYATLANRGMMIEPTTIKSITTSEGELIRPDQDKVLAVSPGSTYLLTKVMEQVIQRGTGVNANIGRPAAGKTGTTNDYADAWFVGFTPDLVAAVWVGYPEGRIPMYSVHGIRVLGGTFPAQIWREFMLDALATSPITTFEIPEGELVTVEIDPKSDLLSAPWCPGEKKTMLRQLVPTQYCPLPPPVLPEPLPSPSPSPGKGGKDDGKGDGKDDGKGDGGSGNGGPEPSPQPQPSPSPTKKG